MQQTPNALRSKKAAAAKPATAGKQPAESGRHKRKAVRRIVPLARQSCKLKVGDSVLPASLVNESRGGFAVWTDSADCMKIGKKVRLQTDHGWFTARVVYLREVAKSQNGHSKHDSWFQLGLKKTGGLLCLLDSDTAAKKGSGTVAPPQPGQKRVTRTKRKLEAAIAEEISHIEQENTGLEPRKVLVYLMGDLLMVRFQNVFAEAKRQLAELLPAERQDGVLKDLKQVQNYFDKLTCPTLEAIIEKITTVNVLTSRHEIDATTGENVFFFTLARPPDFLE
jgi:uncharacterized protein YbcI